MNLAALWCVVPEQMAGCSLRRRVQHAVDRRFNRTRYNAEAVVAAFASQLGRTVDFDAVQGELLNTVHHAFQPAHVSIWSAAADHR